VRPTTQNQPVPGVHASRIGLNVVIREVKIGDDASAFRTLNEEWIVRFFSLEEKDRELLGDPENKILRRGGHIFMASHQGENVGCVALLPLEMAFMNSRRWPFFLGCAIRESGIAFWPM